MSSLDGRVMPFGKYRGLRVDTVANDDPGYLRWLLAESSFANWPHLYDYMREALARRGELND